MNIFMTNSKEIDERVEIKIFRLKSKLSAMLRWLQKQMMRKEHKAWCYKGKSTSDNGWSLQIFF